MVLDGIFCMVDCAGFRDLDYAATELALDQAGSSDIVILNKADAASANDIDAIETILKGPMPHLRMVRARYAAIPHELLFGIRSPSIHSEGAKIRAGDRDGQAHGTPHHHHDEDHHHDHSDEFVSWNWRSEHAVDAQRLRAAARAIPPGVMRAKGILRPANGDGGRLVFQMVGKRYELTTEGEEAPALSSVVAIGRRGGFDPQRLTSLFDDCVSR